MKPDEALRILRRLRFTSQAGRPISFTFIAAQAGYSTMAIYRAIQRGWITQNMTNRLEIILKHLQSHQSATFPEGQIVQKSSILAGIDGRGDWTRAKRRRGAARRSPRKAGARDRGGTEIDIDGETGG